MSFDRRPRGRRSRGGPGGRVVVAEVQGSAPREAGAAMLVWADGQSGTIGGGALEFDGGGAGALDGGRRPARPGARWGPASASAAAGR